jgi:CubicO group peptidase (beta-lactamase class C family)
MELYRNWVIRFIFIILCCLPYATFGSTVPASLKNQINNLLQQYGIPGASVAVMHDGQLLWAEGFGYADIDSKRPVTDGTLFQACSITKTLTSAAVLKTTKNSEIQLDSPVNNYLKRWKIPENKFTQHHPDTIRMLLNHTGAISNPYPDGGYSYDAKLPTLVQVFQGQPPATNPPLHAEAIPGKKYKYCNGCYAILQMLLEDVTALTYPELMHKEILNPLGMKNSDFDNQLFLRAMNRVALPYNADHKRFMQAPSTNPIYSTGLLWTTPTDLLKFAKAIQESLNSSKGFLPQPLAQQLVTPSSTPSRGLGFFLSDKYGKEKANGRYFMHSGNNIGYLTLLVGSVDGKNASAIMINISPDWNAKDYPQFEFIKSVQKLIANYYHWK